MTASSEADVDLDGISSDLEQLCEDISAFAGIRPDVQGTSKLLGRATRELAFAKQLAQRRRQQQQQHPTAVAAEQQGEGEEGQQLGGGSGGGIGGSNGADGGIPIARQLQGLRNNLYGLRSELDVAQAAPGVVAVCRRFSMHPQDRPGKLAAAVAAAAAAAADAAALNAMASSGGAAASLPHVAQGQRQQGGRQQQQEEEQQAQQLKQQLGRGAGVAAAAKASSGEVGGIEGVEVDVVAQGGHLWVEVKGHESFGTGSSHWHGQDSRAKGVRQQALDLMSVAAAPCNALRRRPPALLLHFPRGADPMVASELQALGCHVSQGNFADVVARGQLPPPPPGPSVVNLDTTAMCALVAEVCHGGLGEPRLAEWAERNEHWRACLAAEARGPRLLEQLSPVIAGRQLVAAASAVAQFEQLMRHAGPKERARWQALLKQIEVVPEADGVDGREEGAAGRCRAPSRGKEEQPGDGGRPEEGSASEGCGPAAGSGSPRRAAAAACEEQEEEEGSGGGGLRVRQAAVAARKEQQEEGSGGGGSQRVRRAAAALGLPERQVATLAVGDAFDALTLTANGRAVEALARRGVVLDVLVHRPAWLAGM